MGVFLGLWGRLGDDADDAELYRCSVPLLYRDTTEEEQQELRLVGWPFAVACLPLLCTPKASLRGSLHSYLD